MSDGAIEPTLEKGMVIVNRFGDAFVLVQPFDNGRGWWVEPGRGYIGNDQILSDRWLLLDRDALLRVWEDR